ncbi:hypothetical protein PIB30_042928, partial [Stylosanthes scabra]|nr:hypothetical protein [Stylosanthes scabra]
PTAANFPTPRQYLDLELPITNSTVILSPPPTTVGHTPPYWTPSSATSSPSSQPELPWPPVSSSACRAGHLCQDLHVLNPGGSDLVGHLLAATVMDQRFWKGMVKFSVVPIFLFRFYILCHREGAATEVASDIRARSVCYGLATMTARRCFLRLCCCCCLAVVVVVELNPFCVLVRV